MWIDVSEVIDTSYLRFHRRIFARGSLKVCILRYNIRCEIIKETTNIFHIIADINQVEKPN